MKPFLQLAALALLTAVLLSSAAYSQEPGERLGGVAVGPTLFDLDVRPGETWRGEIAIVAGAYGRPTTLDLGVADLIQDENGVKSSVERGLGVRSAAGWIDVPSELTVNGGERVDVPVVLTCPGDAFGAYSALILVKLRPEASEGTMVAQLIPAISVEFLVRVRSEGTLRLEVEGVDYRATGGSPSLSIAVRNTGVWRTDVTGDILLYPESGGFPERARVPLRSNGRPISLYPGMLVRLECDLSRRLPSGAYAALARLDLGGGRESRARFSMEVGGGISEGEGERNAELGTDLWLDETLFELTLPPGAVRSVPVRVQNLGDYAIALEATLEDARLEEDGSWTFGQSDTPVAGLTIDVSPTSLTVEPKRTGQFRASVKLDKSGPLESAVVKAVRLQGGNVGGSAGDGWETIYDTGALLVVTPAGSGDAAIEITSLRLVRTSPDRNPGSAVLSLENSGGATGSVKGTMILRRTSGQIIATMTMGADNWEPVMPRGRREFRMPLPIVDQGEFVVEAELVQKGSSLGALRADAIFTSTEAIPEGLR
jgi:hypothetical protein